MDVDFIDDEWVKKANNRLEPGAYKGTKEEWRKWYLSMPNLRKGNLFDFVSYIEKENKMIYLSSDTHYYHENICAYSHRPFSSVEDMNEKLIANFNHRVKPEDTVYIIGDFMMGHNFKAHLPWITPRLNGYKILVKGNHDRKAELYLAAGFMEVHNQVILPISGSTYPSILLQHKPPQKAIGSFPYAYVLHGHVHQLFKTKGYWINVGVDVRDYEPKTLDELIEGVEPNMNAVLKKCMNCGLPTTDHDSICSHACHRLMWEDDYDKDRSTRKFR